MIKQIKNIELLRGKIMMKIGIDIDGVLTDVEQWQLDYGSKYYYEKYGMRRITQSNIVLRMEKL